GSERLDRGNGGLTDWPNGLAPYAYGLGFHAYLAERFGADSLGSLATATAGRVPFTGSRAFKRVFGESLGQLWREYESALTTATAQSRFDSARRLTNHGFVTSGPRFLPTCAECPAQIIYAVRTPHEFPALARLTLDGSAPDRLTTRYLG